MDQLHLMNVFVAVVEEEGFAAASRRLKMSPPAVTRAISALEAQLGVQLLVRTTRHVRATDAGLQYAEDARRILQSVEQANESVAGVNQTPKGKITITAPVLFGQQYVMPSVIQYLEQYSDTQVEAVFLDRVVNLMEEGFDLGVRIGQLPDSNMRARKIGQVNLVLVASPDYIAQNGAPKDPKQLDQHTIVAASSSSLGKGWRFLKDGEKAYQRIQPRLWVSTNQSAIDAAKSGFGITRVINYQVANDLSSGALQTVMEDRQPEPLPIHIIHREGHRTSRKVRAFIDLLANNLSQAQVLK